jgi:protein phosphatase
VRQYVVESGDLLILTSDGVHDNLTSEEIQGLLQGTSTEDCASILTRAANVRAKQQGHARAKMDDITVVAVKI